MELYQTVYKDLYHLAYYYLGNPQDAQDAVQDAVLKAYENFGKLRKEEAFRQWIFKILVNCCRGYLRSRKRQEQPLADTEAAYELSLTSGTEMRELLACLADEERLIVALTVFGGYKGEDIAGILGRKHSTGRSKYRRALKKLEKEMQV